MRLPEYLAINIPFSAKEEKARLLWWTSWLFKLCAHRLLNDIKTNNKLIELSQTNFLKYARTRCYEIMPNRRYIDGVAVLIHSTIKSARRLGVNIKDIELGEWLLFQSEAEREKKGNLNIRLLSSNRIEILVIDKRKEIRRIDLKLKIPKGYRKLLQALTDKAINKEIGYPARVVIKEHNFYKGSLHLYCHLQVMVPYDFYIYTMKKYGEPLGDHVGGVDVNVDRINLAIVDKYGRLRDTKTFWFSETISHGYKGRQAWTRINQAIHKMLSYAYHHGVSLIALEDPKIIGYLRYYWVKNGERKSKNYNYKISIFRNKIIETITYKTPLYSIKTIHVNPKGTSHSAIHNKVMKRLGLDKHVASAYLIALKTLRQA